MMKPFYIVTTRFTNDTWEENLRWRKMNEWKGCIYGVPHLISIYSRIPPNARVYVIEMNNDTNKIMGIGVIKNKYRSIRCNIYSDKYYNTYIYRDRAHITREKLMTYDKRGFYKLFVKYLEKMLFKGSAHMKRGQGLTGIAIKWKTKNGKLMSLPIATKFFSYFHKKLKNLPKKERLARLERIQYHILCGIKYLRFQ